MLKDVFTAIQKAQDAASFFKESENKAKVAELISALADAKMEIASIQTTLSEKDSQIKELKEKLAVKGKMIYTKPYYFLLHDRDQQEGPFCQACYDDKNKCIRLQELNKGYWNCSVCKEHYMDKNYTPPNLSHR